MELLKQEKEQLFRTEENLTKDQQVQFLQQTMQGMQQVPAPLLREQGAHVLRGRGVVGSWRRKKDSRKAEWWDQESPDDVLWEERVWGEATQRNRLQYQ